MKNLFLILLVVLLTSSLFGQGNPPPPPSYIGTWVSIKGPSAGLQAAYDYGTGQMNSCWNQIGPRNVMDAMQYGYQPPFCKYAEFITYERIDPTVIDTNQVADYIIIRISSESDEDLFVDRVAVMMKDSRILNPRTGQPELHFGHSPGYYYIKIMHRNSISIFTAQPFYLGRNEDHVTIYMQEPNDIFGVKEKLAEMETGKYAMFHGDPSLDDFSDLTDYLITWNNVNFNYEWSYTDCNLDGYTDQKDVLNIISAWQSLRKCQSPYKRKKISNNNDSRVVQLNLDNLPYELFAKVRNSPDPRIVYVDVSLKANFLLGHEQLILRFNPQFLNGGIGGFDIENEIVPVASQNLTNNELSVLLLISQSDSIQLSNSGDGTLLFSARIWTSASNLTSDFGLKWYNNTNDLHTKISKKIGNQLLEITDSNGHLINGLTNVENNNLILNEYSLAQNYPNPFNPTTNINFTIPQSGNVLIKVYDLLGKELMTLINENKSAGDHSINFNGSDLSSGIYVYSINVNDYNSVKLMSLIK